MKLFAAIAGVVIAFLLVVITYVIFYGAIAYVAIHFLKKLW
jgi:hypothetical protein